jgi:hypothetical protein
MSGNKGVKAKRAKPMVKTKPQIPPVRTCQAFKEGGGIAVMVF